MTRNYNIQDIAHRAGVSRGTVSRVLNDHPAVSDETRSRVLNVMEQLNYRPSFSARHMRTASSNLFGLLTDEVITTPYAVDMIRGAQETLWEHGKVMLVVDASYGRDNTQASLEALLERRVEGVIYATMYHRSVVLPPQASQLPIVLANCFAEDRAFPSVVPDEFTGGYRATQLLLEKGHRRIAFINLGSPTNRPTRPPVPASIGRLNGYRHALAEYNVPFDETLHRYSNQTPHHNYQLARELLQLPNPPTAFFCGNDRTALGCYGALLELGLRIPADVAVVGFDNQLDIAEGLWPPLTTIQLPHYEMGKWAVEYLISAKDKPAPAQPIQHQLDCPLILRESV